MRRAASPPPTCIVRNITERLRTGSNRFCSENRQPSTLRRHGVGYSRRERRKRSRLTESRCEAQVVCVATCVCSGTALIVHSTAVDPSATSVLLYHRRISSFVTIPSTRPACRCSFSTSPHSHDAFVRLLLLGSFPDRLDLSHPSQQTQPTSQRGQRHLDRTSLQQQACSDGHRGAEFVMLGNIRCLH